MIQLAKEDDEEKNSSELNRFFVSHFFVKDPISKKKLRLAQQIREKKFCHFIQFFYDEQHCGSEILIFLRSNLYVSHSLPMSII